VPPLLSKPVPRSVKAVAPAAKLPRLKDPGTLALEAEVDRRSQGKGGPRPLEAAREQSELGQPPLTKLPVKPLSTPWADPLASWEVEEQPAAAEFIMPFANGRVTSLYNQGRRHPAIDLAGALGSPVVATTSRQTVTYAAWRGGYGNAVITRDVYGWTHLYGHLKSISAEVGQVLDQGDLLGRLGSTGYSTGPHVHYEVRDRSGAHVDPVTLLFPGRNVAKGLAWTDVGQFAASPQLASRTEGAELVVSASAVTKAAVAKAKVAKVAVAKASPRVTMKRKANRKKRKAVRYAYRPRRTASYDGD
jgi:murein DD-endopeptidase MepM/ murein hydrolase activator NlpD